MIRSAFSRRLAGAAGVLAVAAIASCAISHGAGSIGGTLTGLAGGQTVVLLNNNADALTLNQDGNFSFATPVAAKSGYSVTVQTNPAGQTCTVTKGTGTVDLNQTNVNDVQVTCGSASTLGGSVTGLRAGNSVVLGNGTQSTTVNSNTTFTLGSLTAGTAYAVTVTTQPTGQTCTVTNGSGTIVAGASVSNIAVNCV